MAEDKLTLEEVQAKRRARERKGQSLARKFEAGVTIDSAAEDDQGKKRISLEKFLDVIAYDPEDLGNIEQYTEDELDYVRKVMSKKLIGTGASAILKCPGSDSCSFATNCPFATIGKEPKGKDCIVETMLFTEMFKQAMHSFEVDPTNVVDVTYVNEFVTTRILLNRIDQGLGRMENAELVIEQEGETKGGDVYSYKEVSPHLEAREKLVRRMERITKLMVGDRQEKYKKAAALKQKDETDTSIEQARKAAAIINAKFEAEAKREQLEEKSGEEVLTPDDILVDSE